jgi:hypothetical protein
MRTTELLVEEILGNDYDSIGRPSLTPYVETANNLISQALDCADKKSIAISTETAELMERWLAAHAYTCMDPTYLEKQTQSSRGRYMGLTGKGVRRFPLRSDGPFARPQRMSGGHRKCPARTGLLARATAQQADGLHRPELTMPPLEQTGLKAYAVVWDKTGINQFGEPIHAEPRQIRVRWEETTRQGINRFGQPVSFSARVLVSEDIPVGALLWQGKLIDWTTTASLADETDLHEVDSRVVVPDDKQRYVLRELFLIRFKQRPNT